jgi:RecB family endonuclease NucS
LENLLARDPTLVGEPLLLVGRQVPTSYGGFIDLLAVDADGYVWVLELKRDRTRGKS